MARTVDQIQADIDAVNAQAALGDTMVRAADGSEVQSRTEAQRLAALVALRQELASAVADQTGTPRRRVFSMFGRTGY
jgi:hypothetical protein